MTVSQPLSSKPRVAVLYQELEAPLIDGVRKPKKPTGYSDSGADIAYALSLSSKVDIVTPVASPSSLVDKDWVFGDTEAGILAAVEKGATHLWANTILFSDHPLQKSDKLNAFEETLHIIGHPPNLVQLYDDKNFVNNMLRGRSSLTLPEARLISDREDIDPVVSSWSSYPVIGKPVRGRGSHGVKLCHSPRELRDHCLDLLTQQSSVIVEQYLAGQEGTVTIMPPIRGSSLLARSGYWALPVVERFNHHHGIAPYNGIVSVTQNSRVVSAKEHTENPTYVHTQQQCVEVARILQGTAPIRIDVRRFTEDANSPFAIFDVNMKPNMTGPGRESRDDQACLTALAAEGIRWSYLELLENILDSSTTLRLIRSVEVPEFESKLA